MVPIKVVVTTPPSQPCYVPKYYNIQYHGKLVAFCLRDVKHFEVDAAINAMERSENPGHLPAFRPARRIYCIIFMCD